ncbi:MAG: nuclear transport factor 2 family protein [Betaproteobacteria bacterium]|nr:nuclear transport factor 2 family protein [Betaproteobacteria bacterium]
MAEALPSEELRAFLLRLYAAMREGDDDSVREMFSASAYLLNIGTDADEWWTGPAGTEIMLKQNRELGGFDIQPGAPVAYSLGNVGWIADRPRMVLPSGDQIALRITLVLVIERGHWRIAQWHGSMGDRNESSFGRVLTKSIEDIEHSVQKDRPDMRPASAPDGTVTIAFTDIESSSALLDRLGDTEFMRLLAWHDRIVREAAGQHSGYVVKSQGDGFMLAFPSAALALRASLSMRERIRAGFEGLPVRIRVGLHSGEAIKRSDDFYGRTVVIAARVGGMALGDEILASDLVYALARGLGTFTFAAPRAAVLKGIEGTFELYPVSA